jgi:hypothetical protein
MDDEARQSDTEVAILEEERRQVGHDAFKPTQNHGVAPLKRKMDAFENQMATIRARLQARRDLASPQQDSHLPAVASSLQAPSATVATSSSTDRLKLPLLRRIEHTNEANAPSKDPFLEVENVIHRTVGRAIYVRDAADVALKESAAVAATKEAQQLGEEARKRMVTYAQNESGWHFEERTSRYQQVMEVKQQAEKAQLEADLQRETARQMKALLRDPYEQLRSIPTSRQMLSPMAPSPKPSRRQKEELEWLWILAAPSPKLPFTPREETPDTVLDSEKELSMYVVYYIAASEVNTKKVETEEQWQTEWSGDCPPARDWMCCSVHGVPPVPELASIRSGMQTWMVAGAGAGHLNGKYVASGVHDGVRSFKSSAGVELFRKCVPVSSALSQVLHGGEAARPESACSSVPDEELRGKQDSARPVKRRAKPSVVLPSGLAAIEKDELDFRSMQRVGSWLSTNEATERNRRMLASRNRDASLLPGTPSKLDGSSVMNQASRAAEDARDVAASRPEVNASLCREWVLFAKCSRRQSVSEASAPPMKGIGLGCLKRHYYTSFEEKAAMTAWVHTKESWLEKNVLAVIIEREAQMERVHHLSHKCTVHFQQNLKAETEKTKAKLLAELNRVRFLTVKVLETIDRWRQHARKIGFARYDSSPTQPHSPSKVEEPLSSKAGKQPQTEAPLLGWSSSITLETGKQLYKGSKAFVSKVKRFRRSEDINGQRERHMVYLGYFDTQEEAERAYDEHAASEARRLNTTVEHLPRRRNVFRSCGKHFAVESETDGPSFCIECKTKQLASISSAAADEWAPPFCYGTGVNYIMKMASDLDFLDEVLPLKAALNDGRGVEGDAFPMRGNVFLLPKTPIQDPDLAVFTTFPSPTAPRLGEAPDSPSVDDIDDEALDRERIFKAQRVFLQELQIYQPHLVSEALLSQSSCSHIPVRKTNTQELAVLQHRLVEALYWDHCAALKIQQQRPPLAMRLPNIWCRPDAGEWSSLVVRGAHQLHFLFEERLEKAGKDMVQRRQQVLTALRQLNKVPLYFVPSRTSFTDLIATGQQVRGDVVQLEVNNAIKRLQRYDSWCAMSMVVQRWIRGVLGRHKARATRKALRLACKFRAFYSAQVAMVAKAFYDTEVRAAAVRRAYKAICTPVYTRAVVMDGEPVIVTFHSLRHYRSEFRDTKPAKPAVIPSTCCTSCARRFHVKARFQSHGNKFAVFRGVCACALNGGSSKPTEERWLVRACSASHNVIYRLRLETPQLQQLLSSQARSPLHLKPAMPRYRPLITDMESKRLAAAVASRHATFCLQNAEDAANTLANWRRMSSEATQTRKSLTVALEKSLAQLDATKNAHGVSIGNAKKALEFASRPFAEAQAWDPLENANDWRLIVEKRQLAKRLEETQQQVERLRVAHFQATYNEQYTRAGASQAQDVYNRVWRPLVERESQAMEDAILLETSARVRMESVMEQLCGRVLTLRDTYLVPTRRRLVIQSPLWHDMAPFRLDIPGLRLRLNHLRRRTLVLSNLAKQNPKTRRMVVTVSLRPAVARGSHSKRDLWVSAYDPVDCSVHNIFLEWELVQLLTGSDGRRLWQSSNETKRSAWRSIADMLLSLTMLDRFTGEFTLQKLQFYHTLRRFSPQFLSSRMMRDLQAGRKCGQGDEVLRQAVPVDGKLCVVVVYENWGDLTFAIYHSTSGGFFRLVLPLREIFDLLCSKPLMLRLWVCCVKSNSYSPTLLVQLLKHVRFGQREDGCQDVRIEHGLPGSKRYQAVLRIQKRQVLVSILEDSAGDFQVSGYDVTKDLTYKLLLEREGLHRILKTSARTEHDDVGASTGSNLATSLSSLLLRRNRSKLYEWICSRLRFHSLLEHPEMVTAGTSPLLFGLHLRESFRILNRWIATSPRNPLHPVSESEIARRASAIDAAAFSSLQFDQLTLVANQRLPLELEKKYVGSIDWVEAVAGPLSNAQPWKTQLPYMRMDFFVRAHTLFARLRGELQAETKERQKREAWAAMEREDHNVLYNETMRSMRAAKEEISRKWQTLTDVHSTATKWIAQWREIHSELRTVTKSTDVENQHGRSTVAALSAAQMLREDGADEFLDSLNLWIPASIPDLPKFISLAISHKSWCPVRLAVSVLEACLARIDVELKSAVSQLNLALEKIERSEGSLENLRLHKRRVVQFCNFLARQGTVTSFVDKVEVDTATDAASIEVEATDAAEELLKPAETNAIRAVNTGILIPNSCDDPIQEVFLADMAAWEPSAASPFAVRADTMVKHLRSFFQQQWRQQHQLPGSRFGSRATQGSGVLSCQRVPYGVLVYRAGVDGADYRDQVAQLNPRAAALLGDRDVCGPALFWPSRGNPHWYQRLLDAAGVHMTLAASAEDTELDETALQRPNGVRSVKYLPWKQFAIERLRIARAVKRCRTTEGVCIDPLTQADDEAEKEKQTVTTVAVEFRQLELSLGERSSQELRYNGSIVNSMKQLFTLDRRRESCTEPGKWIVALSNPRMLRNVLDVYDSEGHPLPIPCVESEGLSMCNMEGVQVEIDALDKPRRLIFSCRDRQTQRTYSVDCDYSRLQRLLRERLAQQENGEVPPSISPETKAQWRSRARGMPIQGWRKLAALAAQFLVFRRKNGVAMLCLELYTATPEPHETPQDTAVPNEVARAVDTFEADAMGNQLKEDCGTSAFSDEASVVLLKEEEALAIQSEASCLATVKTPRASVQRRCYAEILEERETVKRSMAHHFHKHQPAIRGAACGRILARAAPPSDPSVRTVSEWMQMTREDWHSQELRGALVLEVSVLSKLEKAFAPATRCAREYLKSSTKEEDSGGIELQMSEVAKAMGQGALQRDDVELLQSIRMLRWRRRGKEGSESARRAEAYLTDVAEWWRRRSAAVQIDKK